MNGNVRGKYKYCVLLCKHNTILTPDYLQSFRDLKEVKYLCRYIFYVSSETRKVRSIYRYLLRL